MIEPTFYSGRWIGVSPARGCRGGLEQSFPVPGQRGHACLALHGGERSFWSREGLSCFLPEARSRGQPGSPSSQGSQVVPAWGCQDLAMSPSPCGFLGASPGALLLPPAQAAWHSQALHTKLPLDSLSWTSVVLPVKLFISKICHQSLMGQI